MGQSNSANPKQPVQKSESAEQVEQVESNEDDDTSSKLGSLKKNTWLSRKQSEDKPKKPKKSDKKKKKKEEQEEVSSATCISDSDRASLRHSRIELHLEECQPAPDEDDAISLSSCGEDPRKNIKDIENEEPASLLICDYSSSSMTASPGESLSSGQDSGFARGNTIRSVSSEDEHTEKNQKNKENTTEIGTKLITSTVEVTEKCKDYIEKSIPFNSISPIGSPENSIAEEKTSADDKVAESNLEQENAISTSIVPSPKLETQSSITETPEIASQTEETLVVEAPLRTTVESQTESNLGQENTCETISISTVPSPKLETQSSLTETLEVSLKTEESSVVEDKMKTDIVDSPAESGQDNSDTITVSSPKAETESSITETPKTTPQTEIIKDSDLVSGMVKDLVNETLESAVEYLTHEYQKKNKTESNEVNEQESIPQDNKVEEMVDKELNLTEVTNDSGLEEKSEEITESDVILSELPPPPPTPPELCQDKVSGEGIDNEDTAALDCTEKTLVGATTEIVIVTTEEVTESSNQVVGVEDICVETVSSTDSVNVDNTEILEKGKDFEELSYALQVKPMCHLESLREEAEDKSEKDATEVEMQKDEIEALENCNYTRPDDSLLSNESEISADNSMKYEVSENEVQNISDPDLLAEIIQKEEERTVCPSEILISTDLDADDSGINNSDGSLPPFPSDLDESMTENTEFLDVTPSFQPPTPEITVNEVQDNCTDSSSGSAPSPPPKNESKETAENSSSSTTQSIPDNTTGAVFV